MPNDDRRPDPDALAAMAASAGIGRLRIFLGSAPGVGKTWEMLNAAHALVREGNHDLLVGIVETHGRAETQAQLGDLPVLPRRTLAYRGQTLDEFDIDAALARHPSLILIDELAHTNVPGSRHAKRWEDVFELLEAGIDVWATLNVQHLESLNDAVARITGVRVSETLPDRVLERADEIELIDLPPKELQKRLREGKIYRPDVAKRALGGFFREGNLAALREIALRRAAEHVDESVRGYMRAQAIAGPWPAGERVLVLVGSDARAETVIRAAKRLADALHAPWIALHVEGREAGLEARAPLVMASQLGAEVETRAERDIVDAVLAIAADRNVTQIVIGRGAPSLWRRTVGRTLAQSLLRRAPDFALHVVPLPEAKPRARRTSLLPRGVLPWVVATALVGLVVALGEALTPWLEHEALGMLFVAAVVAASTLYGLATGLYAAALGFLAWNILFIPPIYTLTIDEPRDVIAAFVFVGVAAMTGMLASRVRRESRVAQGRIEGLRRIGRFSRRLGEPTTEGELLDQIAREAAEIAPRVVVMTGEVEAFDIRAAVPPADTIDEGSWAAARWAFARAEASGRGTTTLPAARWRFMPMRTVRGLLGVLGVQPRGEQFDQPSVQTLEALADQAAVALERVRLAREAARSDAQSETQKLRTALLNSLSHDLRTPLTSIRGAAETLRGAWATLDHETREDLLASIEQDTARMGRFLANILDLTRLESGQIAPRLARVELGEMIDAALVRVPGTMHASVSLGDDLPPALADATLLEQVLVNVLDNAAKYSPPGGFIAVRARREGGQVCIDVADEGVGIPAEDLPHVFDSFYRARHGDRVAPGTGLGLAIARGMTEAMGGTIEAQSPRPDVSRDASPGTVVSIRLPAGARVLTPA